MHYEKVYCSTILTTREPIQEHIPFIYHKIHVPTRRTVKSEVGIEIWFYRPDLWCHAQTRGTKFSCSGDVTNLVAT